MILYLNMLCFLVHDEIFWDTDCTNVVTKNNNGLIIFHFDVLYNFFHPENFSTTICCYYVFSFSYRKRNWWLLSTWPRVHDNFPRKIHSHWCFFCHQCYLSNHHMCMLLMWNCNLQVPKLKIDYSLQVSKYYFYPLHMWFLWCWLKSCDHSNYLHNV